MALGPVLGTKSRFALAANGQAWAAGMTGRTLGANHAVPILSETLRRAEQKEENSELVGQLHRRRAIHLGNLPDGEVVFQGDYNFLLKSLAFAFGIAGTPTEQEAGVRYDHRLQLSDDLLGVYATAGFDRQIDKTGSAGDSTVWQYQAAKANGFTFSAAQGETCKATIPWMMRELDDAVDPSGWTYERDLETGMEYMLLSQATLSINAKDGAALGAGDILPLPVSIEIAYTPSVESDIYDDGGGIDEPVMRTPPVTRITASWTRITQALRTLLVEAFNNTTALKATLAFAGSTLGAGQYKALWTFPAIYVDSDLDFVAENADLMGFPVEFHAQATNTAPTGMTGITKPIDLVITNGIATDPLATS